MCLSIYKLTSVMKLCFAAQNVQKLIDDGTLQNSFSGSDPQATQAAIAAFDALAENTSIVLDERKEISPFLRYRREILGHEQMATDLRALTMNLWNGCECKMNLIFSNADQHHMRIALELIASYTRLRNRDTYFTSIVQEIICMEDVANVKEVENA